MVVRFFVGQGWLFRPTQASGLNGPPGRMVIRVFRRVGLARLPLVLGALGREKAAPDGAAFFGCPYFQDNNFGGNFRHIWRGDSPQRPQRGEWFMDEGFGLFSPVENRICKHKPICRDELAETDRRPMAIVWIVECGLAVDRGEE